jgi:glycosyltransferase involved in cell wall biosynthesis
MAESSAPEHLTPGGDLPISALILTLNEEANIDRCLDALGWCDDIVVLDSFSIDATRDRARDRGARVYQRAFDNFAAQRNHALDNIDFRHPWILHLDADEIVTPELRDGLAKAVDDPRFRAWKIPSKLMFRGRWLKYSGMYPTYQVRFGHIDDLRFEQAGHGQRESLQPGMVGTLQQPYLHDGFSKGLADWIERHNRYSTDEALSAVASAGEAEVSWWRLPFLKDRTHRRRALKSKAARLPFRPLLRFVYMYVLRLGFLDGRAGFTYCRLVSLYEYWTVLKMRELRKKQEPVD